MTSVHKVTWRVWNRATKAASVRVRARLAHEAKTKATAILHCGIQDMDCEVIDSRSKEEIERRT